jgi:beta-xylosidase
VIRLALFSLCGFQVVGAASVELGDTYTNPVVQVNSPDPGVLSISHPAVHAAFVAVTSSGLNITSDVFPIRTSSNLVDWELHGSVFPSDTHPKWATFPFYAPEVHTVTGCPNPGCLKYWVVYDATEVQTGRMAVGAAWSNTPIGPFTDLGAPLMRAVACSNTSTASAIDATLWQNSTDGKVYLLFKNKCNGVRSIVLQELSHDEQPAEGGGESPGRSRSATKRDHGATAGTSAGTSASSASAAARVQTYAPRLSPAGQPREVLTASLDWEGHDVEGPFLWEEPGPHSHGFLYMFYSGSNTWGSSYAAGVARARSVLGPWEKKGPPVIHTRGGSGGNSTFVSPGHNSVVRAGRGVYLVYHASRWNRTGLDCTRLMLVDELQWGADGWPRLLNQDGAPSDTPRLDPKAGPSSHLLEP